MDFSADFKMWDGSVEVKTASGVSAEGSLRVLEAFQYSFRGIQRVPV